MKEFAAHLLGLHAPAMERGFGFCQHNLESPRGLPSKYFAGPMLLNFSVQMGPGVTNMAWSAEFTYALNRLATNKRLLWSDYKCKQKLAYHVSGKKPKTKQQKINNPGKNDPIPNKNDDCFCSTHTTKSTAIFTLRNYCVALTIGSSFV